MSKGQIIVALSLLLMAVGGYVLWSNHNANGLPPGIAYGNGRIEAVQVDVASKLAGRVKDILVREGDLVEAGQTLARIDITELKAQRLRALADVASAESQVAAAQAQVTMAKAQLLLAEQELTRASQLVDQGFTSQETLDIRVMEHAVAKSSLVAAEATEISRQRSVDAAAAVVQEIDTLIEDGVLVSPVQGRVLYRLAEPGEMLPSGGKVLVLVNHEDIYMEVFLPATEANLVDIGSEARVRLDIAEFGIPATVSFVSPDSQFTPKQVETLSERDKLMFRVKVKIAPELVQHNIDRVKTGLRGVAYVALNNAPPPDWSAFLPDLPPEAWPDAEDPADAS